jgi:hypothetical protein
LVRTGDGEEGWCPDIAMKAELMTDTFAGKILAARYVGGHFEETSPGIIGWVLGDRAYFVTAAATGDFTGDGDEELALCENVIRGGITQAKAFIAEPETYKSLTATDEYENSEKGIEVDWVQLNDNGHAAIRVFVWTDEEVEAPLRLKTAKTADTWLYDGDLKKAAEIITAENVVTVGAASPDSITKGDFTGRFYMQRRVDIEFDNEITENYYPFEAAEKSTLYCYDDQVFEYEGAGSVAYEYDEEEGYVKISGEYFESPLSGTQTIAEPARLRRQPADAGDPIRIIEAEEQVEIIMAWPELVETERGQGHWYYVYYQTKESEKEYAGWLFDKYFR